MKQEMRIEINIELIIKNFKFKISNFKINDKSNQNSNHGFQNMATLD